MSADLRREIQIKLHKGDQPLLETKQFQYVYFSVSHCENLSYLHVEFWGRHGRDRMIW